MAESSVQTRSSQHLLVASKLLVSLVGENGGCFNCRSETNATVEHRTSWMPVNFFKYLKHSKTPMTPSKELSEATCGSNHAWNYEKHPWNTLSSHWNCTRSRSNCWNCARSCRRACKVLACMLLFPRISHAGLWLIAATMDALTAPLPNGSSALHSLDDQPRSLWDLASVFLSSDMVCFLTIPDLSLLTVTVNAGCLPQDIPSPIKYATLNDYQVQLWNLIACSNNFWLCKGFQGPLQQFMHFLTYILSGRIRS